MFEKLLQPSGAYWDLTTKCNIVSWIGPWNAVTNKKTKNDIRGRGRILEKNCRNLNEVWTFRIYQYCH